MYVKLKRIALVASIFGLIFLVLAMLYSGNLVRYTANIDSRPFNLGIVGLVETFEPAKLSTHEERLVASAMYEGLVKYDEREKTIKPLLAKSWKYSPDGKNLTLTLKNNIKFHNGKPLTAQDVKNSWEHNFSQTKEWNNISLFKYINGVNERLEGKSADISGIQVIDKNTIRVIFSQPNAAFISMLTNPMFWVYDMADQVEIKPGTGAFAFQEKKETESNIILIKNEKYHQNIPHLSAINIKSYTDILEAFGDYQNGKLDYLDKVPLAEIKNIKNNDKYKPYYIEKPLLEIYALGFNLNQEPYTGNFLLRRAFNYAIDRKAIIDDVLGGAYRPVKAVLPLGVNAYNSEMRGYTYNPQKAQELLAEAEYPMGEGLKPIILTYDNDEGHKVVAQAVAEQLMELGLQVHTQAMDWDYYKQELGEMKLNFFRLGWYADYPDADNFLYGLYHSSKIGISNFSAYHNPQVDKILDAARAETKSGQERIKLLKRAEEIIVDDAPNLWLFQKQTNSLIGPEVNLLNIDCMGFLNWSQIELLKPSIDEGNDSTPDKKEV